MSQPTNIYPLIESEELQYLQFMFVSEGYQNIIKVVQYFYAGEQYGKKVYNLGFGDYDIIDNAIVDDSNTNNGDAYRVFNTVLNTIPLFFQSNPNDALLVRGSDSTQDFSENCRRTCVKKCGVTCKNYNRRITVYCGYLNKHYHRLIEEFCIFGGNISTDNQLIFENYVPYKKYDAVLLHKIND